MSKKSNEHSINDLEARLAERLLEIELGDRLPSVRTLASDTDMSIGAVSTALNHLEEIGAVRIQKRGHMGSFLEERSDPELWKIAEGSPMVLAFTIPSNLRFEGLATALKALLTQAGIETYLIFIRGSSTRVKALREKRCHAVVLSELTVEGECCPKETVALLLPPGSWLKENRLYYRTSRIQKVGVDPDSYDHMQLTKLEFESKDVELVKSNFTQFPRLMIDGKIDATVWNAEETSFAMDDRVKSRPLSEHVLAAIDGRDSRAALVVRGTNSITGNLLQTILDVEKIMDIQEEVISGKLLPEY